MKLEEVSLKLYNDLARKTDNKDLIKVLKLLCQEEAKHKLALETLYDDHMAELGD
jgi:rubrerythrin